MAYSYEPRHNDPQNAPQNLSQNNPNLTLSPYDPQFSRPIFANPKDRKAAILLGVVLILIGIGICGYLVVDIQNSLRAMQTLQNEYELLREARNRAVMLEERLYSLIKDLSALSEHNALALAIQDEFGIVIEGSEPQNRLTQASNLNRIHGDFGGVDVVKASSQQPPASLNTPPNTPTTPNPQQKPEPKTTNPNKTNPTKKNP
jgi:hypothetical protein